MSTETATLTWPSREGAVSLWMPTARRLLVDLPNDPARERGMWRDSTVLFLEVAMSRLSRRGLFRGIVAALALPTLSPPARPAVLADPDPGRLLKAKISDLPRIVAQAIEQTREGDRSDA